jgi:L-lactate dehydrogenase
VIPIGSYQKDFGVTLSLPSVLGRRGIVEVLEPEMSDEERRGLRKSAESLKQALDHARANKHRLGLLRRFTRSTAAKRSSS